MEISFSVSNLVLQSHNQNKVWKNSFQQKKCLRPLKFWSFVTSKSLLTTYTCSVAKECIILLSNTLSFVEVLSLNIPLCFIRKKITLIIAINSDQSNWKHNSYQSVHTIHTSQIKRMGDPDKEHAVSHQMHVAHDVLTTNVHIYKNSNRLSSFVSEWSFPPSWWLIPKSSTASEGTCLLFVKRNKCLTPVQMLHHICRQKKIIYLTGALTICSVSVVQLGWSRVNSLAWLDEHAHSSIYSPSAS